MRAEKTTLRGSTALNCLTRAAAMEKSLGSATTATCEFGPFVAVLSHQTRMRSDSLEAG